MEPGAKIKLVVTLAVIACVFFVGYKFIPVKLDQSTLEDCIVEEMKFSGDRFRTPDVIRGNIWECARELHLEDYFDKADILVNKRSSEVRVQLYYEREVELPGFVYTWKFDFDERRELF